MIASLLKTTFLICFLACYAYGFCTTIPTGSVGIARTRGILETELRDPGLNCYNPLWTTLNIVDITSQLDKVPPTKCKSLDRQDVEFPGVLVTDQLPKEHAFKVFSTYEKPNIPYDVPTIIEPVQNFIKEQCSQMTGGEMQGTKYPLLNEMLKDFLEDYQKNRPELNGKDTGIRILRVFIEIPKLNKDVEANYQMIATQKTAEEAERYRQLTLLKEKETRNKVEILEAEKVRDVAILKNQELISKEEADAKIAKIRAESAAEQKRMNADAESYASHKKAQDNQLLLTKEYLQLEQMRSYGCQNTIHYGDVPKFLQIAPLQGGIPLASAAAA